MKQFIFVLILAVMASASALADVEVLVAHPETRELAETATPQVVEDTGDGLGLQIFEAGRSDGVLFTMAEPFAVDDDAGDCAAAGRKICKLFGDELGRLVWDFDKKECSGTCKASGRGWVASTARP